MDFGKIEMEMERTSMKEKIVQHNIIIFNHAQFQNIAKHKCVQYNYNTTVNQKVNKCVKSSCCQLQWTFISGL